MTLITQRLSDPFGPVAFRVAGEDQPGKAPLVLIHGVGMQSSAWGPQIDVLSKSRRVIALDMPGHGSSDPIPAGSELSVFLDWLLAVLDALDVRRVNLVGHSMGAMIAGGFAVCHPERVERVALLNGVFRRDAAARAAVMERAALIAKGGFDLETPLKRWFGDTPHEQEARAQVAGWLGKVNLNGYATAYAAFARGDATFADRFAAIPCPLLALTGDGDPNSTPDMARAMADAAPHGHAVVIPGHRHMVNLTAPDAVNTALLEWLGTPLNKVDAA